MKGFATYHPAVVFGFFIMAVVLSVLVMLPQLQVAGLVLAAAFYLCVRGRAGWKVIAGLLPLLIVFALVNPLFNTQGDTVLFTWIAGRPFTAEALAFGASTACMFVAVLLWFFSYNHVMTSDRFTYLFGRFAPAITIVFTMVLRLVPTYQRKTTEIASARSCTGRSISQGNLSERTTSATSLLSALTGWALEGSVITADSMRSRGYGTGRRSSYARYRFTARDIALLSVLAVLAACVIAAIANGALTMEYFPQIQFPSFTSLDVLGTFCFIAFLATPSVIDLWEAASWRISLLKI